MPPASSGRRIAFRFAWHSCGSTTSNTRRKRQSASGRVSSSRDGTHFRRLRRRSRRGRRIALQRLAELGVNSGAKWTETMTDFVCDGVSVRIGRPSLDIHLLDELRANALLLLPHRSAQGPNGIWELARGPQHPVSRLFAKLEFWALVDTNGTSDRGLLIDENHVRADNRVLRWRPRPEGRACLRRNALPALCASL